MRKLWTGIGTALVTPFTREGALDEVGVRRLARRQIAGGIHFLVPCGTTGESPTLSEEERLRVVELVVEEAAGRVPVLAGAGGYDTREVIRSAQQMKRLGAAGILSVTPYYNKPSPRGIVRHFQEVARAAEGTPVLLYNIPSRTAVNMGPDLLAELAQIDGIAAVKQANSDELQPIDGLAVLAGNDDVFAACLDMGGAGGICIASHIVGPEMRRMYDEPEARAEIDASLRDVYETLFITASPTPVKAALNLLGHDAGTLRLPMVEADEAETAAVRAMLERHGLLSAVHTG
jgi:4-hydroxy-tetrahydrodipicolinate synthase